MQPLGLELLAVLLVVLDGVEVLEEVLEELLVLLEEPDGLRLHCSWLPPQ